MPVATALQKTRGSERCERDTKYCEAQTKNTLRAEKRHRNNHDKTTTRAVAEKGGGRRHGEARDGSSKPAPRISAQAHAQAGLSKKNREEGRTVRTAAARAPTVRGPEAPTQATTETRRAREAPHPPPALSLTPRGEGGGGRRYRESPLLVVRRHRGELEARVSGDGPSWSSDG